MRARIRGPLTVASTAAMVVIVSGLTKDDRVVLDGLHRAKPGDTVEPGEWKLEAPK